MKEKKSFFKKLARMVSPEDIEMQNDEEQETITLDKKSWIDDDDSEGQLTVDVYETPNHIVIKTIVAGVRKDNLEIALSRDMATIRGKREIEETVEDHDYFHKELYWGTFSRTILLPQEVDIEKAEAIENQGLLTIRLPKIDKEKQTKLKVKSV